MNEQSRAAIDSHFVAGKYGHIGFRLPSRDSIWAVDDKSIARCDDRTRNRVLADRDADAANGGADDDQDATASDNSQTAPDGDATLRVTRSGRNAVHSDKPNPDRNAESDTDSYAGNHGLSDGRGESPERWGLASRLLATVEPNTGEPR